jgi:hypothetical protein
MGKSTPTLPVKANHRLMKRLVAISKKGNTVDPRPEELDMCARIFKKAGGSWERLFKGGVDDMVLLKRVVKVAIQQGYLTKKLKWG